MDVKAQWTLGLKRPLYVERRIHCRNCKGSLSNECGRFVPIDKNIPSICTHTLALFEPKFGALPKTLIAAVLDNWPPSRREPRSIRMAADEESHKNRMNTPQASHRNPQPVSTSKSTVIPSTQYPFYSTVTANLTTSKGVATITTRENSGSIPIEELEARQIVQTTDVTKATQPKKRGRPPGSKDCQPRKKRAKEGSRAGGRTGRRARCGGLRRLKLCLSTGDVT